MRAVLAKELSEISRQGIIVRHRRLHSGVGSLPKRVLADFIFASAECVGRVKLSEMDETARSANISHRANRLVVATQVKLVTIALESLS